MAWAPHEAGCILACASSDGNVSVLEFEDNRWEHKIFPAHGIGVNAVSWAPALYPGSLFNHRSSQAGLRRLVTGGSDNLVKIWDWKYVVVIFPLHRKSVIVVVVVVWLLVIPPEAGVVDI